MFKQSIKLVRRDVFYILFLTSFFLSSQVFCIHPSVIKIIKAVEVNTTNGVGYSIEYEYEFPDLDFVNIKGLGTVESKGTFKYITYESQIVFRNHLNMEIIHVEQIKDPIRLMGNNYYDFPKESEFPEFGVNGRWGNTGKFQKSVIDILNKLFRLGYTIHENSESCIYITTYSDLACENKKIKGKIAIRITYSVNSQTPITFKVQFIVKEKRSHSEWRMVESKELLDTAQNYIEGLIKQIEILEDENI